MAKIFPSTKQDLTNAYLYVELQKKGFDHKKILAHLIEATGAYSKDIADHVAVVKADQDEFIKNKYSNEMQRHDINELEKDLGPIPALKKFKNFYHSIVEMLDDGSFEVDLFKTEEDYEKGHPTEILNLTPMLELDVAASLNEEQLVIASLKEEVISNKYISLAGLIFAEPELELDQDESQEYLALLVQAYDELYDEACESDMAEAVHPRDKGKAEKKLHKIKPEDLDDLAELAGSGITKHAIRSAESSGFTQAVVDAVEKALVAAGNRSFQKWSYKRGSEEGVKWGKAAESHAEFANYVTSAHISETADELMSRLSDMDLDGHFTPSDDKAADAEKEKQIVQQAYKIALDTFNDDIVKFVQKSGPTKYQDGVEEWYETLWGEKPKSNDVDEFASDEDVDLELEESA